MLGLHVNVFIHVSLKQNEPALQQFEGSDLGPTGGDGCYLMAGDPDYLIRVLYDSIGRSSFGAGCHSQLLTVYK